jgi:four helix bundle protein
MDRTTPIQSHKDLEVWQLSMELTAVCYRLTATLPREEMFGLTSQIRRASVSITANISEGYGRDGSASFIQFLRISQGSARELETHLLLLEKLGFKTAEETKGALSDCERVSKMLRALIRALQARVAKKAEKGVSAES